MGIENIGGLCDQNKGQFEWMFGSFFTKKYAICEIETRRFG